MELISKNIDDEYQRYRRIWELATARKILTPVPIHIDIELTNQCNLRCKMCWQSKHLSYPKGYMDFELYRRIIDEGVLKGVKAIKLQSRGESMLYPRIVEAIKYAKNKGIIDIHLTTNSTLLFENKWYDFLNSGLDILNISLDSDHRKSFNELYGKNKYKSVIENVVGFIKLRRKLNRKKPLIKIQIAKSGKKLDPFILTHIARFNNRVDNVLINPQFTLFDDAITMHNNGDGVNTPCSWLWQRMVINYDGVVTMCCRDYNCKYIMGDITKKTLEDIWTGKKYTKTRKLHSINMRSKIPICAICNLY